MAHTPKYHWLKRLLRWSGRLLAAMVFLLVGMMALLLVPRVQTFVAAHLANYASERLGVDVHIGRFTVEPFGPVSLKEVFIGDLQGDTLFHIASIRVLRPRIHSADHTIRVSALEVDRLRFKLNRSVGAAHSNLTTLLDLRRLAACMNLTQVRKTCNMTMGRGSRGMRADCASILLGS